MAFTFGTFTIIIIKIKFGLFDLLLFFFLAKVFIPIIGWHFKAHLSQVQKESEIKIVNAKMDSYFTLYCFTQDWQIRP